MLKLTLKRAIIVITLLSLLCIGLYTLTKKHLTPNQTNEPQDHSLEKPFPVSHYRGEDVSRGIALYPPLSAKIPQRSIVGGVVAHHLVVQDTIAAYFQNLSNFPYKRVILLGPNHGELGDSRVITSDRGWDTPYGRVHADQEITIKLGSTCAKNDSYPLENDHALEVIMPFIKVYLNEAKVVPLLLSGKLTKSEVDDLVSCLIPSLDSSTIVLVSSDFSHYLTSSNAKQKDKETLALLKSWNLSKIITLNSDHLDSPPSLVALLELMAAVGATNFDVFANTDASVVMRAPHLATTTHYFLNYYAKR